MNDKPSIARPAGEEELCVDAPCQLLDRHVGIVSAEPAGENGVLLTYDPARATREDVRQAAREMAPVLKGRFEKCRMRLQGRACEACALRLERRATAIPGVRRAMATFVGGVMTVTFDESKLPAERVLEEVRRVGAPVAPFEGTVEPAVSRVEVVFTALTLFFLVAGWMVEGAGLPAVVHHTAYLLAYVFGGWFGVQASWQSLRQWTIDVDLLMVLAALGAAWVGAPFEGATLLFLFSLSNVLQSLAIERTRKAIHSLMRLRPETALVRRDGGTVVQRIEQLGIGDHIIVRPGERVPLDAVVVEGRTTLDESSVTGESMPVDKGVGATVFAGTINQTGAIEARVTRLAQDSTIARLIRMVEEAQSEKAQTQRWLDRAEQFYAMGVITFTLGLILVPWLMGGDFGQAFYRAMTVMVVASPCALIISMPATILSAIGGAARRGVLFKGGAHLEKTALVDTVVFDKTGTLTTGQPAVTDVVADDPATLQLAASVEAKSEHPLAHAIVEAARRAGLALLPCTNFQSVSGEGASAFVGGSEIAVGNERFFERFGLAPDVRGRLHTFQRDGKTAVLVARIVAGRCEMLGLIAIADTLRPGAAEALRRLHASGVRRVVMLTGDNPHVAAAIAHEAGIDEFHAGLRPEDKLRIVKQLREDARGVAMVGDGINDAPALAAADVGIAMGAAGTDVAMETADVVLMSNNLHHVAFAIDISHRARRVVIQNLAFALGVIALLLLQTLGFWEAVTGNPFPLTLGVIGHEGSTVLVCLNGLRLLIYGGRTPRA